MCIQPFALITAIAWGIGGESFTAKSVFGTALTVSGIILVTI